jgi:hypothetical protein
MPAEAQADALQRANRLMQRRHLIRRRETQPQRWWSKERKRSGTDW